MKPEEFEVYVIPPNFMEGGTLFGGLLKTRNTVEAVILGLAVGVPVLHLPFSLTVRVVILCLTALPLVLLALIGVSGMSLSAFIRLFFCFLHNRRILSRDGTQGGKNGKTLLPSWAQQRKSDCEAEDPPLPKSRSRFSVDLKQRSVTQFKTFLQEEEAVQPLNALADYIPIEKIEHGVIYTRDHRYVKVVEVVPVNFLLRSAREQRSIIYSFISYLKIAPVKVQFKALTKRADINRHLDTVRRELEHEQDPRCRVLQEDYLKLIRQLGSREAITRRFFLVFEYEPLPGTKRGHEEEDAIASLQTAARTASNYLRQCGNEVISPENEDDATAEILYNILCRRACSEPFYQRVKSVLADYMASVRDINAIPVNEFYAPDSIDLTDLFGTPYITFDNNTLTNKFYILNKAILRTVVDKGNVVAFFITSTSSQIDIPVDSFENDTREIGNTTYDSIDFANPQIESNASANGRYNYYGEIQETGRYGMWNYYLFGTLPYGFDDDSAINLLMLTAFDDSPDQNQVEILRKTAKPNTFAIIASDYYDHISLLPISDEWENIYHLLIRAQSD